MGATVFEIAGESARVDPLGKGVGTKRLEKGRVKNNINPFIFIKFIMYGEIDMKYETNVERNSHSTKFQLNGAKNGKIGKKLDFDSQNK